MENKDLRIMAGLDFRESCRKTFPEKKILTMESMFVYETVLVSMQKTTKMFTRLFEKKISYLGAKFLNALPEDLKTLADPVKLSTRSFYVVAEFLDWRDFDLDNYTILLVKNQLTFNQFVHMEVHITL